MIASTGAQRPVLTLRPDHEGAARRAAGGRCSCWTSPSRATSSRRRGELDGIYLFDIDDLQKQAQRPPRRARGRGGRGRGDRRAGAGPLPQALARAASAGRRCRRCRRTSSASRRPRWLRVSGGVDEKERKAPTDLAESLVKKLLHLPQTALRDDDPDDGVSLVQAVQRLFSLSPVAAVPAQPNEAPAPESPTRQREQEGRRIVERVPDDRHRHARQRARALAGRRDRRACCARRTPASRCSEKIVVTAGRSRADRPGDRPRRQGRLGQGDRGGRCWPARSTSRCTA